MANLSGTRLSGWTWELYEPLYLIAPVDRKPYPVLGRLPDERTLTAASTGIASDRIPPSAHKVVQLGQLDNKCIPIVFIEGPLLEVILNKCGFERYSGLFLQGSRFDVI